MTGIDRATSQVQISGGEPLAYDRLLLTTGAAPRMLDVPGADLPGVVTLRTVADADALRERITQAGRVVVVGAGWIGCEVAACARMLGVEVAMLTPDAFTLVRAARSRESGLCSPICTPSTVWTSEWVPVSRQSWAPIGRTGCAPQRVRPSRGPDRHRGRCHPP